MKDIPLDKAELLSTLLEGILYGFSLVMFGGTIWVLEFRRSTQSVKRSVLPVACLLLLSSTLHLVIDIVRIMQGLILYRDTYPGGPSAYFSDVSHWTFVSKNCIFAIQTLIGDGAMIYRCYVVWQSKPVMIVPVILWCATAVTGIACPLTESQITSGGGIFTKILSKWIKAFYGTAFTTSVLTTFLLASRIWYIDQRSAKLRGYTESPLREVLYTIIDAGMVYFLTLIPWMICFALQSNGQFVLLNMIVPIISITFYMVILRIRLFSIRESLSRSGEPTRPHDASTSNMSTTLRPRNKKKMRVRVTIMTERKDDDGRCISPMSAGNVRHGRSLGNIEADDIVAEPV